MPVMRAFFMRGGKLRAARRARQAVRARGRLAARRATGQRAAMRVTLLAVQSLDGFITHHDRPGSDFSGTADKIFLRTALRAFDCFVMGRATYAASRQQLKLNETPPRRRVVLTRAPEKFAAEAVP